MALVYPQLFDAKSLERYMLESAALVPHLHCKIASLTATQLVLAVPLPPNINHKGMAFGGSLHAVATLACWGMMSSYVGALAQGVSVVISRSEVDYLAPVREDFEVSCLWPEKDRVHVFMSTLVQRGKARMELEASVTLRDGTRALAYKGTFAAMRIAKT